jgi:hypothetical protein
MALLVVLFSGFRAQEVNACLHLFTQGFGVPGYSGFEKFLRHADKRR